MSKPIAYFVADVHLDNFAQHGGPMVDGLNDRARATLAALTHAATDARWDNAHFFIAGDLFHTSRPTPALISAMQRCLRDVRAVVLVGNHDQASMGLHDNALSPLSPVAEIASGSPSGAMLSWPNNLDITVLSIGFTPGPPAEWIRSELERCRTKVHVLCIHAGISDSGTPYYLDGTTGSISAKQLAEIVKPFGVRAVFAGDWHRHQVWNIDGVLICQIGSLAPSRFPPNYEHGHIGPMVELYDDFTIKVRDIPGPRFYKHRWTGPDIDVGKFTGQPAFVRIECRTDQRDAVREWIASESVAAALVSADAPTFEIVVDRGVEQAKVRAASFEARQASSLDEALANYVQRMPVGDGVDRQQVLAHVRRLMA